MDDDFLRDVKELLTSVNKDNFNSKHEGMINLIIDYNIKGLKREKIIQSLNKTIQLMYSDNYDDFHDEVLTLAYDRITGFVHPHQAVNLEE